MRTKTSDLLTIRNDWHARWVQVRPGRMRYGTVTRVRRALCDAPDCCTGLLHERGPQEVTITGHDDGTVSVERAAVTEVRAV